MANGVYVTMAGTPSISTRGSAAAIRELAFMLWGVTRAGESKTGKNKHKKFVTSSLFLFKSNHIF